MAVARRPDRVTSPEPPGWVDLHVHYLPGIDDGPATLVETLAMLRLAYDSGSRVMVATPHLYSFVADSLRPAGVREAFARTHDDRAVAGEKREHAFLREMSFHEGAENHLGPELLEDLERQQAVTLDRTRHLLVELPPFMAYDPILPALERIIGWGYVPVLAHVERYPLLFDHPDRLAALLELGCLAQVNAGSVAGAGGRRTAKLALTLLSEGLAAFVASDGHDDEERPPDMGAAATALAPRVSESRIAEWLRETPERLLGATPR